MDRHGEVGVVAHEQHVGAEAGGERLRVERATGELGLELRLDAERLAGEPGGVRRAHLGTREACVDLDTELLQRQPGGTRLLLTLLGEWPLRVRGSVRGVSMAQQPQHEPSPYRRAMEAVTAPPEAPALDSPELFANREMSWLQFNERVLALAEDERTPLLERVKFLAIYASNLDEFFMVRVAGLHDQVDAGIDARGPDGLAPSETIVRIAERTRELGHRHSHQWDEVVRLQLAEQGIREVDIDTCSDAELESTDRLFTEQIFPVLTPLAVGPGRPFPYISNLSLSIGVFLR